MDKMIFLILSLVTGVLELGVVWYGLYYPDSLATALIFVLAYQLGNLAFVKTGKMSRRAICVAILGSVVLLSLVIYSGNYTSQLVRECIVIFASSLTLQTAREKVKSECATGTKRFFRILGFLLSPIMTFFPLITLMVSLLFPLIALLVRGMTEGECRKATGYGQKVILTMMFHQMHYFVYTYVFLWWFSEQIKLKGINCSEWITAIGFALTWLVYMMPEVVCRKRRENNYRMHFFIGHSFLLVVMPMSLLFAHAGLNIPLICLWIMTGIGGGTVYAIPKLTNEYQKTDMKLSEDMGHVFGVLVAIVVSIVLGDSCELWIFLALSAVFILITLALAMIDINKERKNHE